MLIGQPDVQLPDKPTYKLDEIFELRKKIYDDAVENLLGKKIEGDDFDFMVEIFCEHLPSTISSGWVRESLEPYVNRKVTKSLIDRLAWRVAGNLRVLRSRRPVYPWVVQLEKEWVPAQITSATRAATSRGKAGWTFKFSVLAGSPCSFTAEKFWSDKLCYSVVLKTMFGFNKRSSPSQYATEPLRRVLSHPTEYVNMRLWLFVEPDLCNYQRKQPGFSHIDVKGALLDWNKEQIKYRERMDAGYTCPNNYPLTLPCYRCAVGYNKCRAATHRLDYSKQYCTMCSKLAVFDFDLSEGMCLNCFNRNALQR